MKRLFTLLSLSLLLALARDATAQQPAPVAAIGHRDVTGQLALLNRNKADLGSRWDHWYAAPLVHVSADSYVVSTERPLAIQWRGGAAFDF
jgi:hypothetical protein